MGNARAMSKMLALSLIATGMTGGVYGGIQETPEYHSPMCDDNRTEEQKWKDEQNKLSKSKAKNERKLARLQKQYPNMRSIEDFK